MTSEIDRVCSRYRELSGKPCCKLPQWLLDLESAYRELVADHHEMVNGGADRHRTERLYRNIRRLSKRLKQAHIDHGSQFVE